MSAGVLASTYRCLPLRLRRDLEFAPLADDAAASWIVKDLLSLQYHWLEASQYLVLSRLDGRLTQSELLGELQRSFPAQQWSQADLQGLLIDLHRKGLVVSDRTGQSETFRRRREEQRKERVKRLFGQLLSTRLPGWNPCRFLEALLPWVRWIYHPFTIAGAVVFVVASWLLILVEFAEFRRRLPEYYQFFGASNVVWLWITLAATKVLHEFGHGLACHYYGRRCHEMGVMLLLFTPTLYCDASDAWMLRDRWQRVWVGAGGMVFELVLGAVATQVWWWTLPGHVHNIALNIVFVSALSTVLFNANPLMRYDGYYMLSDWLGIPNLRMKADRLLDRAVAKWACGQDVVDDPLLPQHHQVWFALYSLAGTAYQCFILTGILVFLYTWLKPQQLQSIGIAVAGVSAAGTGVSLISRGWRIAQSRRRGRTNWRRIVTTWGFVSLGCCGLLWIPVPWYVEAGVVVEPADVVQILNPVPGSVQAVHVQPGDRVTAGQLLLDLQNSQLENRVIELETEMEAQAAVVASARARADVAEFVVASERLSGLQQQLSEANDQWRQLAIVAPIDGTVVVPDYKAAAPEVGAQALPGWHATPLDPQNLSAWLEARTHLASLAPTRRLTAILYVPQAHREEISPGCPVSLKFDSLPDQTFRGRLIAISHEHADVVPAALSNKLGGPLATITAADHHEHLQELAYRGEVNVDDPDGVLRTGLRGRARFVISRHTAGWWLVQTLRRTFRFRM